MLTDGFRYGETGPEKTEEIVEMSMRLLNVSGKANMLSRGDLRNEFHRQLSDYPAEILAEHFAKPETLKGLFDLARSFEGQAYASNLLLPNQCPSEQKAVIAVLCDFYGVDRKNII